MDEMSKEEKFEAIHMAAHTLTDKYAKGNKEWPRDLPALYREVAKLAKLPIAEVKILMDELTRRFKMANADEKRVRHYNRSTLRRLASGLPPEPEISPEVSELEMQLKECKMARQNLEWRVAGLESDLQKAENRRAKAVDDRAQAMKSKEAAEARMRDALTRTRELEAANASLQEQLQAQEALRDEITRLRESQLLTPEQSADFAQLFS